MLKQEHHRRSMRTIITIAFTLTPETTRFVFTVTLVLPPRIVRMGILWLHSLQELQA